jgi:predicted RNase H-like nuclease
LLQLRSVEGWCDLMSSADVLGIDLCRRGWIGVLLRASASPVVLVDPSLAALVARAPGARCIAIDMPIGLPASTRLADTMARRYVGSRRNSVFMTPPRPVLVAPSYAAANEIAPVLTGGRKITRQAWALRRSIATVEAVAAHESRVIEVHPEVSFRTMHGAVLMYPKSSWNGQLLRRRCLSEAGIVFPDWLAEGGEIPPADVLDAGAAAWTARRYAAGEAESFPAGAYHGQREVIWY